MAPKTRSRGAAPAGRTYHSSPALRQVTFAAGASTSKESKTKDKALKTYAGAGKRRSLPASLGSGKKRSHKGSSGRGESQQSLTQMPGFGLGLGLGFLSGDLELEDSGAEEEQKERQEDGEEAPEEAGVESGDDEEAYEEVRPRKRRKTMGDVPNSSSGSAEPRSGSRIAKKARATPAPRSRKSKPNAATRKDRTLTQMIPNLGGEALAQLQDSDVEEQQVEQTEHAKQPMRRQRDEVPASSAGSPIQQTPVKRRLRPYSDAIEPPPLTNSPPAARQLEEVGRSPLQEVSTNMQIQRRPQKEKKPRTMIVQDSYSTGIPSSSAGTALSSASPGQEEPNTDQAEDRIAKDADLPARKEAARLAALLKNREIADSDDELASLGPTPTKKTPRATESPLMESPLKESSLKGSPQRKSPLKDVEQVPAQPDTEVLNTEEEPAAEITPEARVVPETPVPPIQQDEEDDDESPGTPTPLPRRSTVPEVIIAGEELEDASLEEMPQAEDASVDFRSDTTQDLQSGAPKTQISEIHTSSVPETPSKAAALTQQIHTQTQSWESQRVPHEVIRAMGPQTDRSDIVLSIHPDAAEAIADGTKTHEFRNYKLPIQISRIWLYITAPKCQLTYMAIVGPAIEPGEMSPEMIATGDGNGEFSGGKGMKFAHELLQVYELNNPVPLARMKENGWMQTPPQRYVYIPPAVVGQLLANLRCALFEERDAGLDEEMAFADEVELEGAANAADATVTISQEVEEQIRTDIAHSTQLQAGEALQISSSPSVVPLSQEPSPGELASAASSERSRSDNGFAKPALPPPRHITISSQVPQAQGRSQGQARSQNTSQRTAASQSQQLPAWSRPNGPAAVRPSQATTASGSSSPVPTVITISPGKSVSRRLPTSAGPQDDAHVPDSQQNYGEGGEGSLDLGSSLPAVLPESLIIAATTRPDIVWDSDEDL
jgi:predicted transcriptional regulator